MAKKLITREQVLEKLSKIPKGTRITVKWADAAEIRQLSKSKFKKGKIPQRLLETIMQHTGDFIGIQEDQTSGRKYLILLLDERDSKVDIAVIPVDLIFSIKDRKGRELLVVKVPMLTVKYENGSIKESGGVIKVAD